MKKRIFGLTVLALSTITLASCGGNDDTNVEDDVISTFDGEPGESVNSITFKNRSNEDITINKTDTYDEMISKLDYLSFEVENASNGYHPFTETLTRKMVSESLNTITKEMEKREDGKVYYKQDANWTKGNTKSETIVNVTENVYKIFGDYNFAIGDISSEINRNYELASGNLSYNEKSEDKDQGTYISTGYNGNSGSIEYASTDLYHNSYTWYMEENIDFYDEYKATYFNENYNSYRESGNYNDLVNSTYKASNYDITFKPKFNFQTISSGYHIDGNNTFVARLFNSSILTYRDYLKDYLELSFELTDKYLIVKNKINCSDTAINHYDYFGTFDKALAATEGSSSYLEVWIDYNNIINNRLGYAYCKYDSVEIQKSENQYQVGEDIVESLGLTGQKETSINTTEFHIETKLINTTNKEIKNKKNDFINYCKNNNFLTKYNFTKVTN